MGRAAARARCAADGPAGPAELRDSGLSAQFEVAEAFQKYANTVAEAFELLLKAHAELAEGPARSVEGLAPLMGALLEGLNEAAAGTRDMAKEAQVPLNTQRDTISACGEDFAQARCADLEFRHYSEKVKALTEGLAGRDAKPQESARLERNQDSLDSFRSQHKGLQTSFRSPLLSWKCWRSTAIEGEAAQCGEDSRRQQDPRGRLAGRLPVS